MRYAPDDYLALHFQNSGIDLAAKVDELLALTVSATSANLTLYREMLVSVIRTARADRNRWDAKIMLQTLREMENAFSSLEQFKRRRKVTVFGSARTPVDHPVYRLAHSLGVTLARYDLMVVTGGGGGIMAAAHAGAGLENSLGFNISLPFEQSANATVEGSANLLSFHFFFLRKLFFVKEADALVFCPGGFGTLDEALEVLTLIQTGKSPLVPLVLLDEPDGTYWKEALAFIHNQLAGNGYILESDMRLMRLVHSAEEAAEEIAQFYRNFHSSRGIKDRFAIRMNHALSPAALSQLDKDFADICLRDGFEQLAKSDGDWDTPELRHLPRLLFVFNGRNHGRLRQLIDFINLEQHWAEPA